MLRQAHVRRSRVIDAPPLAVWVCLARFGDISRWAQNVDHSAFTTEKIEGVSAARRVQSGALTVIETVTEWDPERTLTYTIEGLPPRVGRVSNSWGLEPDGAGTRVTITTTVEHGGSLPGRVAAFVLGRVFARIDEQLLSSLDRHHRSNDSP